MDINFKYDEKQSIKTNVMACVNWLNNVAKEMYNGRVPQNKELADGEMLKIQSDIVESVIDEYNTVIGG